jgi:AcrR family transcriptional regulator
MNCSTRRMRARKPRRGRPPSVSVDRALIDAAVSEFTARGFNGMSMQGIAASAAVSKVSLYRRWPSKVAVARDVLRLMSETAAPEDHGSLEADVRALVEQAIGSPRAHMAARVFMRTMGEISGNPKLLALYKRHLLAPRIEQVRTLVERARARGELRPHLSTDVAVALIGGPLFMYSLTLLTGADVELPRDLARALTEAILEGIRGR